MYGILFDSGLYMEHALERLYTDASWKLSAILRTSRFFDAGHVVYVYKTKVMSYIEFRTSAIYHASDALLQRIDSIQNRMLKSIGVEEKNAISEFHLAPLRTRRDMAMLGIIHRAMLGLGPDHFRRYFRFASHVSNTERVRHNRQIVSHRHGKFLDVLAHSVLGAADIYNLLPQYIVDATTTKEFQHRLQELVCTTIEYDVYEWQDIFSPRKALHSHALKQWTMWKGISTKKPVVVPVQSLQNDCVASWLRFGS